MGKYTVRTRTGKKHRQVDGYPVSLQYGVQAFVHLELGSRILYAVTELRTGIRIAGSEFTQDAAIKAARAKLRANGSEEVWKVINQTKEDLGTVTHP